MTVPDLLRGAAAEAEDLTIGGTPCPVWTAAHTLARAILDQGDSQ